MINDETKFRSQKLPIDTKAPEPSTFVPTRVGGNTVQIDPSALRHLVKTMKAKLKSGIK